MSSEDGDSVSRLSIRFKGERIDVIQEGFGEREEADLEDTTGRIVWECNAVQLRWLEDETNLERLCGGASTLGSRNDSDARLLLDLSSGTGIVVMALHAAARSSSSEAASNCSSASAKPPFTHLVATETYSQLPLLRRNIASCLSAGAKEGPQLLAMQLYWGDDPSTLLREVAAATSAGVVSSSPVATTPMSSNSSAASLETTPHSTSSQPARCKLVGSIAVDLLYVAIRDGLRRHLSATLRGLAALAAPGCVFFGFQVRLPEEENDFMEKLQQDLKPVSEEAIRASYGLEVAAEGGGEEAKAATVPTPFWAKAAPALIVQELSSTKDTVLRTEEDAFENPLGPDYKLRALLRENRTPWESPPFRLFLLSV